MIQSLNIKSGNAMTRQGQYMQVIYEEILLISDDNLFISSYILTYFSNCEK